MKANATVAKKSFFSKEEINTIISIMSLVDEKILNKFDCFKSIEAKLLKRQKQAEAKK